MTSALCLGLAAEAKAEDEAASKDGVPNPSISTSLPEGGDKAVRAALADKGITFGVNYIGEIWGNTGGTDQSVLPAGRLEGVLDADLEKLLGLNGLTVHANVYQYHGSGLSRENLGNIFAISSIEALPGPRLFELYAEQQVNDIASVRLGQMAVDSEFLISANGSTFVNGTFGWTGSTASNLPNGGMAYPLATPGVRVKLEPSKNVTILAAMFNGDPAGGRADEFDPQDANASGLLFPVNDPPFFIEELQYKYNTGKDAWGLPGTIKLGAWQHTGDFEHLRLDEMGTSTALTGADAALLSGSFGFYLIADQQIYRFAGGEPEHGVHIFGRISTSPEDRNLVDFYADGGVVVYGAHSARPDDAFGIGVAYAQISNEARALDREVNLVNGTALPIRSYEALFEAYYKFQVAPGLTVQPDLQYVVNPGGHIPGDDGNDIDDALVGGVRVTMNY